ncbi:MAG TPA: hypothetical protein VF789_26580 [Thermoanaerobaculia bacterium]
MRRLLLAVVIAAANTLYYVAFVDLGEVLRIMSLRRAERREAKYYVENV